MNTRQAFRDVFRPVLTEHGFRYNGKVFSRLNGEILQGIVVVPSSGGGYFFRYACYPYWLHNLIHQDDMCNGFQKPWWVEQYDVPGTHAYFNKNGLEKSLEDMREYSKLIEEQLLPHLDAIKGLDSLQAAIEQNVLFEWFVNQYVLLYIVYRTRAFDFASYFIERLREEYFKRMSSFPFVPIGTVVPDAEIQASWESMLEHRYGNLLKAIETNDFDSILSPHWENRAALKARIEKELKLDVSHLL